MCSVCSVACSVSCYHTHLATNHDSPGHKLQVGVLLDAVVQGDDMQAVQQLPLVLMDSLHLHVKDRGRVHFDVIVFLDICRQLHFVLLYKKLVELLSIQYNHDKSGIRENISNMFIPPRFVEIIC